MKKWFKGFLLTAAGRAQLVGWLVAIVGTTAYGHSHPEFLKALTDNLPAVVAGVVAIIGSVDAAGVVASNAKKADAPQGGAR